VNFPGNAGEFDIVNQTGPNSSTFPDTTFPISSTLSLSSLTLVVTFSNSSTVTEPLSYFALSPDGESFDGSAIPIGGTNPLPVSATLTGDFSSTSITVNSGGAPVSILPTFSVTLSDSPTLVDQDLAVIYATTGSSSSTPEPGTWISVMLGLGCLLLAKGKSITSRLQFTMRGASVVKTLPIVLCLIAAQSAFGQVKLNAWTAPSSGVAGVNNVNIGGTSFPTSGTITPANVVVTIAATCGGTPITTAPGTAVTTVLGSSKRVQFNLPITLATGDYFLTVADSAAGDADFTTLSGSCSEVSVTATSSSLNACLAGSSLGVLLPGSGAAGNVTAYVPKGYWGSGTTGLFVQNIEGTIGTTSTISTPGVVNSCSANPATGQTVCVANDTDVYLITGTSLNTTLTSSSNTTTGFSGGSCHNCGVAIDALNNTAVINMGLTGGASGSGVQVLNLNTNTFNTAFPMHKEVSENISIDPTRSLILSADEGGNYVLLQIQSNGSLLEFDSVTSTIAVSGGESDSSAEDCSTGIAITPNEGSDGVFIEDLTQSVFTPGSPAGTYTSPNSTLIVKSSYGFSAGLDGSAVAQGSGHLAVVTGEFGGNTFVILELPSTSGSGTPAIVDYASAQIPSSTACGTFSAGYDPHTITAYTSPNNGKSYAVFAGYSSGVPVCLAVVDMAAVLAAPRGGSGYQPHDVSPANLPASALTFFKL
jgi:hypothetical protein